jgi:hypothetical protein
MITYTALLWALSIGALSSARPTDQTTFESKSPRPLVIWYVRPDFAS